MSAWVSKSYQGKLSLQVCLAMSGVLLDAHVKSALATDVTALKHLLVYQVVM